MGVPLFSSDQLRLIAITDDLRDGIPGIVGRSQAAVRGGATMLQLRLKHASAATLLEVARALVSALPRTVPVIVNDRADIALAAGAAGVHLGTDDLPVHAVRKFAPSGFIIGASVGSVDEVTNAELADYVGIGPAFETETKSDAGVAIGATGIRKLSHLTGKPSVAIGGIDSGNLRSLRDAGAAGIAVVRAILGAPDPETAARTLRSIVDSWYETQHA
jgi:thiamine-phosphate pyrophosphorylase